MAGNSKPGSFGDQLASAVIARNTPAIVGLDPRIDQLPSGLQPEPAANWVEQAAACENFCRGVIDVVAPLVPAVKPQAAFFEALGPAGMSAMQRVIAYARARRLLVILDGKRNDIGSTAVAYAEGYLGAQSAWGADALTVNPYLGADGLEPFVQVAAERDAGIFVLVKTSNPGSGMLQDQLVDGQPLYRRVAQSVEQWNETTRGREGYGSVGAVVGATWPEQLVELRSVMPHAWLLVPGFGSQGATARDVRGAFDERGLGAVVNNARGIIFAHARREYAESFGAARWQEAVEAATREMIDQLRTETSAGRLCAAH